METRDVWKLGMCTEQIHEWTQFSLRVNSENSWDGIHEHTLHTAHPVEFELVRIEDLKIEIRFPPPLHNQLLASR